MPIDIHPATPTAKAEDTTSRIAQVAYRSPVTDMTADEKIDHAAARILHKYKKAFPELAK